VRGHCGRTSRALADWGEALSASRFFCRSAHAPVVRKLILDRALDLSRSQLFLRPTGCVGDVSLRASPLAAAEGCAHRLIADSKAWISTAAPIVSFQSALGRLSRRDD